MAINSNKLIKINSELDICQVNNRYKDNGQYLYVVFSSTPTKMGEFIRTMTVNSYNHVSIALDSELKTLYSFARHYKDTPFFGGFVKESCLRYKNDGRYANIKVCAIPISRKLKREIFDYLQLMSGDSEDYVYNMFSAMVSPLHMQVKLKYAFTCVEFVIDLLKVHNIKSDIDSERFYSIKDLEEMLSEEVIYTGSIVSFTENSTWEDDTFPVKRSLWSRIDMTFTANKKLLYFLVKELVG